MHYFYTIENEKGELYFGSTNDLRKRLREHNAGKSHATKGHDWELVQYEAYKSEADAREREQRIKQHGQAKAQLKRRITRSRSRKS